MKNLITIVLFTGTLYSQCNEKNWKGYYKSESRDMSGCYLKQADLEGANFQDANLEGANF